MRVEVFDGLASILFGMPETVGDPARGVTRRLRIASPMASAAASIRSVCFLTSCRSRARLSISSNSSSVAICGLLFPWTNFNSVALSLASSPDFFGDINGRTLPELLSISPDAIEMADK